MRIAELALVVISALLPLCFAVQDEEEVVSAVDGETGTESEDGQEQLPPVPPIPTEPPLLECYDYIVVGAGSAGSVVANRLSANGTYSVLVIEAGGEPTNDLYIPFLAPFSANEYNSWSYYTVEQKNACLSFPGHRAPMTQGKLLGGTSGINSMCYVRGNKEDFDSWKTNYSADGWGSEDVLYYFKQIENFTVNDVNASTDYHGFSGETPINYPKYHTNLSNSFLNACSEFGYKYVDYNDGSQHGYSRLQSNTFNGTRRSAYTCFLQGQRYDFRRRLKILANTTATKIIFQNKTAIGVEYEKDGQTFNVTVGREVIVSAGAIGSAQLLMLSGIGPKDHLQELGIELVADLPVGDGLQDHVVFLGLVVTTDKDYIGLENIMNNKSLYEYIANKTGLYTLPGAYEALIFTTSSDEEKSSSNPDMKLALTAVFPSELIQRSPYVTPELYEALYEPLIKQNKTGFMNTITMGQPKSRGTVRLNKTNPHGLPLIDPNVLSNESDITRTVKGILKLKKLFDQKAMKAIKAEVYNAKHPNCTEDFWSEEYVKCVLRHSAFPSMHVCCTCGMGNRDGAVVDARLKVRGGVQRVRVADASVMPHITSGNTNAPVMMIGAKAAEMIIADAKAEEQKVYGTINNS